MSALRKLHRNLDPRRVYIADHVAAERIKVARQVVKERCDKDAEFARDVLKAVGDALPKEIKETCEKTIAADNQAKVEETKALVEKWDKSGLLEGIKDDITPSKLTTLIESQPTILASESHQPIVKTQQATLYGQLG
jgi:hypothetical protein